MTRTDTNTRGGEGSSPGDTPSSTWIVTLVAAMSQEPIRFVQSRRVELHEDLRLDEPDTFGLVVWGQAFTTGAITQTIVVEAEGVPDKHELLSALRAELRATSSAWSVVTVERVGHEDVVDIAKGARA